MLWGPTFSSCRGLLPLAEVFFSFGISRQFLAFKVFLCKTVTLVNNKKKNSNPILNKHILQNTKYPKTQEKKHRNNLFRFSFTKVIITKKNKRKKLSLKQFTYVQLSDPGYMKLQH